MTSRCVWFLPASWTFLAGVTTCCSPRAAPPEWPEPPPWHPRPSSAVQNRFCCNLADLTPRSLQCGFSGNRKVTCEEITCRGEMNPDKANSRDFKQCFGKPGSEHSRVNSLARSSAEAPPPCLPQVPTVALPQDSVCLARTSPRLCHRRSVAKVILAFPRRTKARSPLKGPARPSMRLQAPVRAGSASRASARE